MRISTVSGISLAVLIPLMWAAPASASMDDIVYCTNITDDAARLECFDLAVSGTRQEMTSQTQPNAQPDVQAPHETQQAEAPTEAQRRTFFGLPRPSLPNVFRREVQEETPDEFGQAALDDRRAREEGTRDQQAEESGQLQEITAGVIEWGQNPLGKYFVVLDNGHVWRQTDDGRMPFRRGQDNTVRISRNRTGGFFLRVNQNTRTFRVQRIR